jgi:hypothetical protein
MISTYAKDFSWKKMAQINQISKKKIPNQQFLMISSIDLAKNIEGFFIKKILLSFVKCCQIWLSYFLDNRHFDDIQNP